jgi:predicted DNA binding CopG/RHH family protein
MEAFAGFDWDDANRSKCQKHGVPIAEIEAVFQGRFRVAPDTKHSAKAGSVSFAQSVPVICMRKRLKVMKRKIPKFTSDEQAEAFLDQDLSNLDFSQFKPTRFEFQKKTAQINLRVPKALLEAVKRRSAARGIPYTRFIREALEQALHRPEKSR